MSQYCGVPCVCSVHGAGDEIDSSAFICVQADSVGYSISDATCSYVPFGTTLLNDLSGWCKKQPLGKTSVPAKTSVRILRRRSMPSASGRLPRGYLAGARSGNSIPTKSLCPLIGSQSQPD